MSLREQGRWLKTLFKSVAKSVRKVAERKTPEPVKDAVNRLAKRRQSALRRGRAKKGVKTARKSTAKKVSKKKSCEAEPKNLNRGGNDGQEGEEKVGGFEVVRTVKKAATSTARSTRKVAKKMMPGRTAKKKSSRR